MDLDPRNQQAEWFAYPLQHDNSHKCCHNQDIRRQKPEWSITCPQFAAIRPAFHRIRDLQSVSNAQLIKMEIERIAEIMRFHSPLAGSMDI